MQTFNEIATYSGIFSAAIRSPLREGASNGLLIRDDSLLARESCCCLRLAVRRGPKAIFRDTLKVLTGLFVLIWISIGQVSFVSAGALLQDLENALMCKCDDKCGKVLMNCTCSTSDETRVKFSKMLESGLTVEQIIKMQVVLPAPFGPNTDKNSPRFSSKLMPSTAFRTPKSLRKWRTSIAKSSDLGWSTILKWGPKTC